MPSNIFGLTMRGLLIKNNKLLLLKRHPKSKNNPGKWEPPGGKSEKNEYFDEGLVREFIEETGLKVEVVDYCSAIQHDMPSKRVITIFMYVETDDEDIKISDEHTDVKWVDLDELNEIALTDSFKLLLENNEIKNEI